MNKKIRQERGERLKKARIDAHLSQTQMAERLGCSRQLVGALEAGGNLSADQLEKWCVVAGCSSDAILFGTPETQPGDLIAQQFVQLEPGLRSRLWMLYQVFVRRGAPDRTQQATS